MNDTVWKLMQTDFQNRAQLPVEKKHRAELLAEVFIGGISAGYLVFLVIKSFF